MKRKTHVQYIQETIFECISITVLCQESECIEYQSWKRLKNRGMRSKHKFVSLLSYSLDTFNTGTSIKREPTLKSQLVFCSLYFTLSKIFSISILSENVRRKSLTINDYYWAFLLSFYLDNDKLLLLLPSDRIRLQFLS